MTFPIPLGKPLEHNRFQQFTFNFGQMAPSTIHPVNFHFVATLNFFFITLISSLCQWILCTCGPHPLED